MKWHKVYILSPLHEEGVNWLRQRADVVLPGDPRAARWHSDADALIVRSDPVTRADMERAVRLKVISKHGIGMDVIDTAAAKELGITVTNTPTESVQSVAEQAVALMLAVSRRICRGDQMLREGAVPGGKIPIDAPFIGCELFGKTVGLVGLGRIAIATGEILHKGFRARIKAYAPDVRTARWAGADYAIDYCGTLEEMVADCDYISAHLPLSAGTWNLIDGEILARCKPEAIVVNTGRGGVVNDEALCFALKNGIIQGAAYDVFCEEPPAKDHPLLGLPNFVASPHMGANSIDALRRQSLAATRNAYDVLTGCPVASVVV